MDEQYLIDEPAIEAEWHSSPSLSNLLAAMAVAQGQIQNAARDSVNPQFKKPYADLTSVWDAIREPFSANGISVIQLPSATGGTVTVKTILGHSSGEWIVSSLTMSAQRQLQGGGWEKIDTPQAIGSAITYCRRYALAAVSGVAPEDDDGNEASGRGGGGSQRQNRGPEPPPPPPAEAGRRPRQQAPPPVQTTSPPPPADNSEQAKLKQRFIAIENDLVASGAMMARAKTVRTEFLCGYFGVEQASKLPGVDRLADYEKPVAILERMAKGDPQALKFDPFEEGKKNAPSKYAFPPAWSAETMREAEALRLFFGFTPDELNGYIGLAGLASLPDKDAFAFLYLSKHGRKIGQVLDAASKESKRSYGQILESLTVAGISLNPNELEILSMLDELFSSKS